MMCQSKMDEYNRQLTDGRFEEYYKLLTEHNKMYNITRIVDRQEVYKKHFLDSLLGESLLSCGANVLDVGCGAGFPSIPIVILRSDLSFVLCDSVAKKINFVKIVLSKLKLDNVHAIHTRIEDCVHKGFDFAISRAVAHLATLSEYCLPFVKIGGSMIAYKSREVDSEIEESLSAISIFGGELSFVKDCWLDRDTLRKLIVIKKVRATPAQYPRGRNLPRTEPLLKGVNKEQRQG